MIASMPLATTIKKDLPMEKRNTALVLGATGGLGNAYCKALASRDFHLILSGRNESSLNALAVELRTHYSIEVQTLVADLCSVKDRSRVLSVIQENAALNWFVNASGVAHWRPFMELSMETQQDMFQVNLLAPIEFVRCAIDAFQKRGGGTIVHIASAAAFFSIPFIAGYCATKGAIVQLLTSIREEIRGQPIRLQALCPGFVKTEIFSRAGADAERLPSVIWISPERVVRESLRAVDLNRAICVPGKRYRLMIFSLRFVPAFVTRRIAGWLLGNFAKYGISKG